MQSNNTSAQSSQQLAQIAQFSSQSAQHMTHMTNPTNPADPYEKCAIQFQLPNAIIWQIKFILSSVSSKKSIATASAEFNAFSESFGKDFDKYLIKELLDQIELKEGQKTSKDKMESVKITLLNQELARASLKPEFLSYFSEIMASAYGADNKGKPQDFIDELSKRLKLDYQTQILVTLSLLESTEDQSVFKDTLKVFKSKLTEFHANGKPDQLPEYAVHRILYLFDTVSELQSDPELREPKQFIIEANLNKYSQFIPLRSSLHQDISLVNCHTDLPSYNILRDGCGLDHLEFVHKVLQPWEILIDIGHSSSYMYDFLYKTLSEFKQIDEKVMAMTLLQLAIHHQEKDDHISKIVYNTFESNKDGSSSSIKKEPEDKKTLMTWSIENLVRAFRELYSNLNWNKVFDSFGEIEDNEITNIILQNGLDQKQFQTLIALFNKSKPQNFSFPLINLFQKSWRSASLQLTFIRNCIDQCVQKKDKSIQFNKLKSKTQTLKDLQEMKERDESAEMIDIWQSIDLVERLVMLSEEKGLFAKVRKVFDHPIKKLPEYLLLSLSYAKPSRGSVMIDELLSLLLPQFLGDHVNSPIVLQHLFDSNQELFIRGMCELCKHDQRLMNLSRVLDITQEVKDSLKPIVYCDDFNFAVNLGVLAAKRDFLHYDVWIKSRIEEIGTPFINALVKYIWDNIIIPVSDFVLKNQQMVESNPENFEAQKSAILERSHISQNRLVFTIEQLQDTTLRQNENIQNETHTRIQELVVKNQELFPQHYEPGQNSDEIEAAANEHFQRVFSAEDEEVDGRIEELIKTMQAFKESRVVKEQEIYACMLHGLFDEYRFLHRYPPQYLTKIAKLFGAIIKNKLLDRVLQDIALKFVFEAFRRDRRRQQFGIIVIKSFFEMLPQFPQFLEDIYQIRSSIQTTEPQMMADIERLYRQMINDPPSNQNFQADAETANDSDDINENLAVQIADQIDKEESKQNSEGAHSSRNAQFIDVKSDKNQDNKKITEFQKKNQPATKATGPQANQQAAKPVTKPWSKNAPTAVQGTAAQKTTSTPMPMQANIFVPTNKTQDALPNFNQNQILNKVFVPTTNKKEEHQLEQSQLVDHVNNLGVPSTQQFKKTNLSPAIGSQLRANSSGGGSLNINSTEFQRPMSSSNIDIPQDGGQKQININSKEFLPSRANAEQTNNVISQTQIKELLEFHKVVNDKIKAAITKESKLRIEDLIEDSSIVIEKEFVEDQLRIICNNTVRNNFKVKIEELKKYVVTKPKKFDDKGVEIVDEKSAKADEHLKWFLQYILTRRLGPSNLHGLYVDMIRELHTSIGITQSKPTVMAITMTLIEKIFKKCMVIDEDEFSKVTMGQSGNQSIKSYLNSLGTFIGCLTLAKNEPIRSSCLDIKQILIEAFQLKSRKLSIVISFVCKILKETQLSRVFYIRNPWILSIMQILREIQAFSQMIGQQQFETFPDIDFLFKSLNINSNEIKPHGILDSLRKQNGFADIVIKKELDHFNKKTKYILPQWAAPAANQSSEDLANSRGMGSDDQMLQSSLQFNESEILRQQMSQTVSIELIQYLQKFPNFNEDRVRRLVGTAVDNSIVEILPPVVDRSVTIALITTRELVLKDFAFDGDYERVLRAAKLIVQNLAGSLALVTCREPLRMSLNTNLKRIFETHFKRDIGIEVIRGSQSSNENNSSLQADSNNSQENHEEGAAKRSSRIDGNGIQTSITEEQINDISVIASRENLELGCMLIKKKVIEKALRKVREDVHITQAVERRQRSEALGIRMFRDENIVSQFQELPPQLQPNQNGLTPSQFKVYEDFQRLNTPMRDIDGQSSNNEGDSQKMAQSSSDNERFGGFKQQNLTQILTIVDQQGLNESSRSNLVAKLQQMNQPNEAQEDKEKLWTYVQRNFETACKNYDSRTPQTVEQLIQILSLIVTTYTSENYSSKLLTKVFFQLDVRIFNDLELNILLMSKGIISISEWDRQIANHFKEEAANLQESELQFFSNFLETSIVEKKILTKEEVPQLIAVIESMSHDSKDRKIGNFCQYILDTLSFSNQNNLSRMSPGSNLNYQNLREFFIKWVVMSYVDDKENQEKQINTLFTDLRAMGIDTDPQLLLNLSKVMIKTSIEKALYFGDDSGEKRPADRLDFRYIDSFVKLIVILLKMLKNFNMHEIMTKMLEFIEEVLDEDHRVNKANFNQRPYYRMLMNILIAVNHPDVFNPKTQLLILYSMADLFKNLNPLQYPAFCFAWLELISHNQFLPHFLRQQQQNTTGFPNLTPLDNTQFQQLIVRLFTFLKNNMIQGKPVAPAIQAFYHSTLRVINVIKLDYPDFLSDYHFNFVNSIPDHCIQLRNLILSAYPANIQQPDPFLKNLKIDKLIEIKQNPRILSNYKNYLSLMNLREDLESYTRTRNPQLITEICHKMEQSEEIVKGNRRINSNIISAVVLFIANQACQEPSIEQRDTFKLIVLNLNDQTRLCFLNAIVNELRYPNNHTFYFSCIILFIYSEAGREIIQEQISSIFLERLQTCGPYPWGLMISFRELIQNPKYKFMQKQYIRDNQKSVQNLFQKQLRNFFDIIQGSTSM